MYSHPIAHSERGDAGTDLKDDTSTFTANDSRVLGYIKTDGLHQPVERVQTHCFLTDKYLVWAWLGRGPRTDDELLVLCGDEEGLLFGGDVRCHGRGLLVVVAEEYLFWGWDHCQEM